MSNPSENDLVDQVVNEWLNVVADLEKLTTRKKELDNEIIAKVGVGRTHEVMPGVGVRVQAGARRFDPAKAAQRLPDEWLALCNETKLSAKLATANLPGYLLALCKSEPGEPTVRIV